MSYGMYFLNIETNKFYTIIPTNGSSPMLWTGSYNIKHWNYNKYEISSWKDFNSSIYKITDKYYIIDSPNVKSNIDLLEKFTLTPIIALFKYKLDKKLDFYTKVELILGNKYYCNIVKYGDKSYFTDFSETPNDNKYEILYNENDLTITTNKFIEYLEYFCVLNTDTDGWFNIMDEQDNLINDIETGRYDCVKKRIIENKTYLLLFKSDTSDIDPFFIYNIYKGKYVIKGGHGGYSNIAYLQKFKIELSKPYDGYKLILPIGVKFNLFTRTEVPNILDPNKSYLCAIYKDVNDNTFYFTDFEDDNVNPSKYRVKYFNQNVYSYLTCDKKPPDIAYTCIIQSGNSYFSLLDRTGKSQYLHSKTYYAQSTQDKYILNLSEDSVGDNTFNINVIKMYSDINDCYYIVLGTNGNTIYASKKQPTFFKVNSKLKTNTTYKTNIVSDYNIQSSEKSIGIFNEIPLDNFPYYCSIFKNENNSVFFCNFSKDISPERDITVYIYVFKQIDDDNDINIITTNKSLIILS